MMAIPPEKGPEIFESEPLDLRREYSQSSLNPDVRFEPYKYAHPEIDPLTLISNELRLGGTETILDIGCSSGKLLHTLRENGHKGQLLGLDIDESLFIATRAMIDDTSLKPIDFIVGNAEVIPLGTSSTDVSTAMFMLYHCDPLKALEELKRVTKPEGMIVVATSGSLNKTWHRCFEELIALELGCSRQPRFNAAFDTNIANVLLPQIFPDSDINHISQEAMIALEDKPANQEQREAFEASLLTMKDSMVPRKSYAEWKVAMNKVWKYVDQTLTNGEFLEYVQRDYYFCRNNK